MVGGFFCVSKTLARIYGGMYSLGMNIHRDGIVKCDLRAWTRAKEVDAYADRRGITTEKAIRELVNHALSDGA
jgi:hypothetical protein